jgi:hypothetical protein
MQSTPMGTRAVVVVNKWVIKMIRNGFGKDMEGGIILASFYSILDLEYLSRA